MCSEGQQFGDVTNHSGISFVGNSSFHGQNINFNHVDKLQCLKDLHATDPADEKLKIEASEEKLIEESYQWIVSDQAFKAWIQDDKGQHKIFRITGGPGKGKTMNVVGIINHLFEHFSEEKPSRTAISYFFCRATDDRLSTAVGIAKGLLHRLMFQPANEALINYLKRRLDSSGGQVFEGQGAFPILQNILMDVLGDSNFDQFIFVIDALDECKGGQDLDNILKLLRLTTSKSSKIKWLVSSRDHNIVNGFFRTLNHQATLSLDDHTPLVDAGITAYIEAKVDILHRKNRYPAELRQNIFDALLSKAEATYLWVHLACKTIENARRTKALDLLSKLPSGLNEIYEVMTARLRGIDSDDEYTLLLQSILSTVLVALRPLRLSELMAILDTSDTRDALEETIENVTGCGSFLRLNNQDDTIYFIHQSAKEYLEGQVGRPESIIPHDSCVLHQLMAGKCLRLLTRRLRQNMCDLPSTRPGFLAEDLDSSHRSRIADLEYACFNWCSHIECSQDHDRHHGMDISVNEFLHVRLLYWLETLGLMTGMIQGIAQMNKLQPIYKGTELQSEIDDIERFMREYRFCIEKAPLQVYSSALLFSPAFSWVKENYQEQLQSISWLKVAPTVDEEWSGYLQVFDNDAVPSSVAISHDTCLLAAGFLGGAVKIWDITTGQLELEVQVDIRLPPELNGPAPPYSVSVSDLCFTADNSKVLILMRLRSSLTGYSDPSDRYNDDIVLMERATGILDLASKDVITGFPFQSKHFPSSEYPRAHLANVWARFLISPNGSKCAGHCGPHVILFNMGPENIGDSVKFFRADSAPAAFNTKIVFSPKGDLFAADQCSDICLWNGETGEILRKIPTKPIKNGDRTIPFPIALSGDGKYIAVSSYDGTEVRSVSTGHLVSFVKGIKCFTNELKFSPSGRKLTLRYMPTYDPIGIIRIHDIRRETEATEADANAGIVPQSNRLYPSGRLLPDGRVLCDTVGKDRVYILDPDTNRCTALNIAGNEVLRSPMLFRLSSKRDILAIYTPVANAGRDIKLLNVDTSLPYIKLLRPNTLPGDLRPSELPPAEYSKRPAYMVPEAHIRWVAVSPDGTKFATGSSDQITVWSSSTSTPHQTPPPRIKTHGACTIDSTAPWVARPREQTSPVAEIPLLPFGIPRYSPLYFIQFSHDGSKIGYSLITGNNDRQFTVYDIEDDPYCYGSISFTWKNRPRTVTELYSISPCGTAIAVGSSDHVGQWKIGSRLPDMAAHNTQNKPKAAVYSKNGAVIAFNCQGGVILYYPLTGTSRTVGYGTIEHPLSEYWSKTSLRPLAFCANGTCLNLGDFTTILGKDGINFQARSDEPAGVTKWSRSGFNDIPSEFIRGNVESDRRVSLEGSWLKIGSKKVLWIPPSYRPISSLRPFIANGTIVVVRPNGKRYFLRIDLKSLETTLGSPKVPDLNRCRFCDKKADTKDVSSYMY